MAERKDDSCDIVHADRERLVHFGRSATPGHVLAGCDILVFPSIYDTCAKVVLEAMAMGLSVITSSASGLVDVIDDGENGFVVENPNDVDAFVKPLSLLVRDPERREQVGTRAASYIAEHRTWEHTVAETRRTYELVASAE